MHSHLHEEGVCHCLADVDVIIARVKVGADAAQAKPVHDARELKATAGDGGKGSEEGERRG